MSYLQNQTETVDAYKCKSEGMFVRIDSSGMKEMAGLSQPKVTFLKVKLKNSPPISEK